MNERKILSSFVKDRQSYEEVKELLDRSDFDSITLHLIDLVGEYYATDPKASTCDVEILADRFARQSASPKLESAVKSILSSLPEVSGGNVLRELREIKAYRLGLKLANSFTKGQTGPEVQKQLHDYLELTEAAPSSRKDDEEPEDFTVESLVRKSFNSDGLIKLLPKSLTEHLDGGVRPGHHILVFAPTEMGKTLVVINMVAGFTMQGLRTLYVGNEDPVADLQMRYISRLTNFNKREVLTNQSEAQRRLDKRNYKNVIFAPLAPGNFRTIRRLVERFKPQVVILDQLRNIDVDSENRTQALEKAATEARNLAKSLGLVVISVSQAADSASGKRVLSRGDVDSSNIGIPGQMDVMIGIGADEEMEKMGMRMLSFPKNKISGRHQPIEIVIDPQLSKVIEAANDSSFGSSNVPGAKPNATVSESRTAESNARSNSKAA
jgi:archaellum biogenesis ATPase FlaH